MNQDKVYGETYRRYFYGFIKVICCYLFINLLFVKTHQVKDVRRFTSGFVLEIDPVTPAYSVLEDEYLNFDEADQRQWIPQSLSGIELVTSIKNAPRVLAMVNDLLKPSVQEIQSMRTRLVASLKPEENNSISQLLHNKNTIAKTVSKEIAHKPVPVISGMKLANRFQPKTYGKKSELEIKNNRRKIVLEKTKINLAQLLAENGVAYNLEVRGKRLVAAKPTIKMPKIPEAKNEKNIALARKAFSNQVSHARSVASSKPLLGISNKAKSVLDEEGSSSRSSISDRGMSVRDATLTKSAFDGGLQAAQKIGDKAKIIGMDDKGNTKWVVHRGGAPVKPYLMAQKSKNDSDKNSKPIVTARRDGSRSTKSPGKDESKEVSAQVDPSDFTSFATGDKTNDDVKSISLKGRVQLMGGLAFTGDGDHIVLYRKRLEEVFEYGRVFIDQGEFEIFVEENVGKLVAEMRSSAGDVLGRGQVAINIISTETNQVVSSGYEIEIKPVSQGITGKVVIAGSSYLDNFKTVKDASVHIDGFQYFLKSVQDGSFLDQNANNGSNAILKVTGKDFWDTIQYTSTGKFNQIELYADKLIDSLKGLVFSDRETLGEVENNGIIWGVVRQNNQTVSGAQVKLGEEEQVKALYFNEQMLPDPSLQTTSSNGLYVFINVDPGISGLEVIYGQKTSDLKIIPVEEKTVSRVDFDLGNQIKVPVEVFDAKDSDQPVSASYRLLGTRKDYESFESGEGGLEFNLGLDPLYIEVDGNEIYSALTVTHQRTEKIVEIPMIKTDWILRAYEVANLTKDYTRGEVVGFVKSDASISASIDQIAAQDSIIIYFDKEGDFFINSNERKAIGYVVLNAPQGLRSIIVESVDQTIESFSINVGYVEPDTVSVLTHEL